MKSHGAPKSYMTNLMRLKGYRLTGIGMVCLTMGFFFLPVSNTGFAAVSKDPVKQTRQQKTINHTSKPILKAVSKTSAPSKVMDLNSIIRGLAPIAGQVDASRRSIDLDIPFEFNSSRLSPPAEQQLQELGKALNSQKLKHLKVKIIGHTDAAGGADYNKKLSRQRAKAVADYLQVRFKVDAYRLEVSGRGEEELKDPLHPESSLNRRVEIVATGMISSEGNQPEKRDDGIRWSRDTPTIQSGSGNKK